MPSLIRNPFLRSRTPCPAPGLTESAQPQPEQTFEGSRKSSARAVGLFW